MALFGSDISQEGKHHLSARFAVASISTIACLTALVLPLAAGNSAVADETAPTNIVTNGDFEAGASPWVSGTVWNAASSTIAIEKTDVHGGSNALQVTNRKTTDSGVVQDLSGKLVKGDEYNGSMWIKPAEDATFNFTICSGDGSGCVQIAKAAVKAGAWTEIKGSGTLDSGNASFANPRLLVETAWDSGKLGDFLIDDVTMTSGSAPIVRPAGDAQAAKKVGNGNPIVDYWYGADPWAMEYNGRVYVYTTGDATAVNPDGTIKYDYDRDPSGNIADNSFGKVQTLNVLSSDDMVNWQNEGYVRVAGENGVAKWAGHSWAPAAAHKTVNGKEKFFLYFADGGGGVGVLTADSPVGPWTDGGRVISWGTPAAEGVVWLFDPAVLVDSNGTGYLYYGGGVPTTDGGKEHPNTARVIQLSDDMTHTVGDAKVIDAPAMFEDSGIAKIGDTYYYSYCTNFSHDNIIDGNKIGYGNIAYMTSKSPMGPFTYDSEIMQNPSTFFDVGGNNHHAMVQLGNSWYMVYHAQTVAKELTNGGNLDHARGYRNTHFDHMTIDADGSIAPVTMTYKGLTQVKNLDAYPEGGIPASTIAWDSGIQDAYNLESGVRVVDKTTDNSQGQKLSNINDGEWTSLSSVDFGKSGAKSITVNAAGKAGGTIDVSLDSQTAAPSASITVPAGDSTTYADYTATLNGVKGVHNVFFTFKATTPSAQNPELFDISTYSFAKADVAPVEVDKTALQQAAAQYEQYNAEGYTQSSWNTFQTALASAKNVLASESSTQADVDAALAALNAAHDGLLKENTPTTPGEPITPVNPTTPTTPATSGNVLAKTGVDGGLVAVAAVILLAGGLALLVFRRNHA